VISRQQTKYSTYQATTTYSGKPEHPQQATTDDDMDTTAAISQIHNKKNMIDSARKLKSHTKDKSSVLSNPLES